MKLFRTDTKEIKEKSVVKAIDVIVNTVIPISGDIMIYNGLKNEKLFSKEDNKKLNLFGKAVAFYVISGKYVAYANIAYHYLK